jgi:hypothetical protein
MSSGLPHAEVAGPPPRAVAPHGNVLICDAAAAASSEEAASNPAWQLRNTMDFEPNFTCSSEPRIFYISDWSAMSKETPVSCPRVS